MPPEVLDRMAWHFTTAEWCRGPALTCKTLHNIRLSHLFIQPGKNSQKMLQALAWLSGNWGSAKCLVLELQLRTKVPRFGQALARRLEAHNSPLSQVAVLACAVHTFTAPCWISNPAKCVHAGAPHVISAS